MRCFTQKRPQYGTQDHHDGIVGGGNRKRAGDVSRRKCFGIGQIVEVCQQLADDGYNRTTLFGGGHALVVAHEKLVAELLLTLTKRAARGRNCQIQLPGRFGKRPCVVNFENDQQVVESQGKHT